MSVVFGLVAGGAFFAGMALVVRALLTPGGGAWATVADAAARGGVTRAVVRGPELRAPRSGAVCAWSVTWVLAGGGAETGARGGAGGGPVALERSDAPVVVELRDGDRRELGATDLVVQSAPGAPPFGLSSADRMLLGTTPRRSYPDWAAGVGAGDGVRFGEVTLAVGAEVELVTLGDGRVACLVPGEAALAAHRAQIAALERWVRWRHARWAGLVFVVAAVGASATA